jgi:hypothetical protein
MVGATRRVARWLGEAAAFVRHDCWAVRMGKDGATLRLTFPTFSLGQMAIGKSNSKAKRLTHNAAHFVTSF